MAYHIFNIGQPANTAWWQQNLYRGVITAGYEGEPSDRGSVILQDMNENDWVLAYVNGRGYVGAGKVLGEQKPYRLLDVLPPGSLSDHLHERGVDWQHAVSDVSDAVTLAEAGRKQPRQTKEREANEQLAEHIIALLRDRGRELNHGLYISGDEQYWLAADAVKTLHARNCRPVTADEIRRHIKGVKKLYKTSNTLADLSLFTVNDRNRGFYQRKRSAAELRSDLDHKHDLLYRSFNSVGDPVYEPYDAKRHGVWELVPNYQGKPRMVAPGAQVSLLEAALEEARDQLSEETAPAINSEYDARIWALRSVAERQGQPAFRAALLVAYGHRCAITACSVSSVLEAAHIVPHRGQHTMRVDNGLLLRADIHTLFDQGYLWVDPDSLTVQVDETLLGSEYEKLRGKMLRLPENPAHHPKRLHLAEHRRLAVGHVDNAK
jgi:hypothetical protein